MSSANNQSAAIVYGLVLSGGASTRMQRDKATLEYQGHTQLQRACALLQRHCQQVFVSIRADQQQDPLRLRWPRIVDVASVPGPLAGIAAAQRHAPQAAWLVLACDMPLLDDASIARLLQQRDATRLATAFRNPQDQAPEPLCTIWEPASHAAVDAAVNAQQYSPRRILQNSAIHLLDALHEHTLSNVNTPDEHARIHKLMSNNDITLHLQYFAILREQAGKRTESITTAATTPTQLYAGLQQQYGFTLALSQLKVAVNNQFRELDCTLQSGDTVTFIPPVAGG